MKLFPVLLFPTGVILSLYFPSSSNVDIPLEKGDYNLKIWSIDHQPYNAVLELSNIIADLINYKDLKNFEKIKSILKNNYLIAKIKVDEPGIYEFFGERNIYYSNKYGFNFVSSNNKINVLNNYFWVFYRPSKNNIYFSKFIFDGNFYNTTSVNIYGENPVLLDIKSNKIGPTVTISSTKYNQIMSGFVTGEDKNSLNVLPEVFISSSNIFDNNKCLSIALPGKANKLMLWNPEENSKDITFNTNIELYYFKKPLIENNINFGKFSDKIKGLSQIKYNLPKGNKSIEFVLRKNMIAYTFDEDSIKDIFWARDDYNSFYLETNLDKFIILNLYNSISAYEITVLNKQKISTSMLISQESMFEKIYQDSGEININIDGKINDNKLLNITGNISECILINKNGKIHKIINEKPFILLNEISYLKIKYNPGLVKVWISEKDNILEKRWGKDSALNKIQLENFSLNLPPANNNSYEFTVNTPSMVYVSSQEPYVVAMQKDGAYLVCNEILSGSFNYFLSVQGNYQLKLRSINDKQFQDEIEFSIVPIIEITDTLGPETIIEKNESKAFSFIHKQKGYIGIAVKAFKDILNCEVYSNDQKLIKSGRLLYLNLDAGQYFLKVVPNNDNEPLKFKPVIAGIVEQPSSPPKEYIKEFFEKYGIK
ncbi:hypothetical protein HY745_04840 [Candidatus Desantisbacteria bacterium]|nr:hypothetical protein [Candidatus Desantisbacteria bacterium]